MITLEQVEKLRQYGDITYDEAKMALEEASGDILEAIIILERQGVIQEPKNGGYHTSKSQEDSKKHDIQKGSFQSDSNRNQGGSFSDLMGKLFKWFGRLINRGNMNHFDVMKGDYQVISIPVTILALLLLFTFWITIPILIVGLFFGYRYMFSGPDLGKENVNDAMNSVAYAAEKIKNDMKGDKSNGENFNNRR